MTEHDAANRFTAEVDAIQQKLQKLGAELKQTANPPAEVDASLVRIQEDLRDLKKRICDVSVPQRRTETSELDMDTAPPPFQARMLAYARTEAEDLACEGQIAAGDRILLDGLEQARLATSSGKEWAAEWVVLWEQALLDFRDRWQPLPEMQDDPRD